MKTHKLMIVAAIMAVMALASCQPEEVKPEPQPQPVPEHNMFYGTIWYNLDEGDYGSMHYIFLDELTFETDNTGEWFLYINIDSDSLERLYNFTYTYDAATQILDLSYFDPELYDNTGDTVYYKFLYDEEEDILRQILEEGTDWVLYRKEQ